MTEDDKRKVEEELQMEFAYDWFLDDNPEVLERVDKGGIEGRAEGEIRGLQRSAVTIIKQRFPLLALHAQQRVEQIQKVDELEQLIRYLASVTSEADVRQALHMQEQP